MSLLINVKIRDASIRVHFVSAWNTGRDGIASCSCARLIQIAKNILKPRTIQKHLKNCLHNAKKNKVGKTVQLQGMGKTDSN